MFFQRKDMKIIATFLAIISMCIFFSNCNNSIFGHPTYEKYFPTSVGNTWTFNSIYEYWYSNLGASSDTHYEGVEIWEIIANDEDTLTLEINFNGYNYFRVYADDCDLNGGPYLDSTRIDVRKVIKLIPQRGYWKYSTTTVSNTSFNKIAGLMLIKDSGIPYDINSNELEVRHTIYDNPDDGSGDIYGHLYWDIKLHQGPIYGERRESTWYWGGSQSIELLSYSLNE